MTKRRFPLLFFLLVVFTIVSSFDRFSFAQSPDAIDLSTAVVVASSAVTTHAKAADMLHDEIMKRTRIRLAVQQSMPDDRTPAIVLGDADAFPIPIPSPPPGAEVPSRAEGYSIWVDTTTRPAPTVLLAGRDKRGALYAAGKLLRLLSMGRDVLALSPAVRVSTAPDCPLRGHQMGFRPKTNSYDGWTVEMWEQYFRDMVVFGMNAVELIPPRSDDDLDSPHFPLPPMEMMVEMSRLADQYDLDVWIWYPAIDDDYTDPATVEFALKEREEVFSRLPRIDALFIPGGDPGDTHPAVLMPFIEKQKALLNRYHPKAEAWVSPQGFDREGRNRDGWLKAFLDILKDERPAWLDGVVFGPQVEMTLENLRKETPSRYRIRRYPDITHCRSSQYEIPNWDDALRGTLGREPINPRPEAYAKIYRDLRKYAFGYITYSEGCNDDVNKVVWSSLGWDPDTPVEEILTDYSRYFISERYAKPFAQGLAALERNWRGPLLENEGVFDTLKLFQRMEADATPQELLNWRFQQALFRAYYDAYIRRRLIVETEAERRARAVLKTPGPIGSLAVLQKAEAILDKAATTPVAADWRARVFELAEALFQSIRMQKSVPKYQAIRVNRGANLDEIDKPLNHADDLKEAFEDIRKLRSEKERFDAISEIVN